MRRSTLRMIVLMASVLGCVNGVCAQDSPHGDLSVSCDNCHDTDSWEKLASPMKFSHASTGFALDGRHAQVACKQCHATLRFSETPDQCASCHQDVHRKELGASCERCHSPGSWLVPDMPQRHLSTRFALLGAHRLAQCAACHTNQQKHTYAGAPLECVSCHRPDYDATVAPPHRTSGISTDCEACHSVSALAWGRHFDHSTTGFTLVGAHATAACAGCHQNNVYKGLTHDCYGCHAADYAAAITPPHQASGFSTDCVQCHASMATTWGGKFDHATTAFPLNGSHAAVPCLECHKNNVFKGLPATCYSCHSSDYTTTSRPAHLAAGFGTDCVICHSSSAVNWAGSFNHAQTGFSLTGSHAGVACVQCHVNNVYKGLPSTCVSCHQQEYNASTNPAHATSGFPTACETCHSTSAWAPSTFDHEPSFPISSNAVHRPGRWSACADCHTSAADFRVFSCLNCHEHAKASMDAKHSGNLRYSYTSSACYSCHPRGRE